MRKLLVYCMAISMAIITGCNGKNEADDTGSGATATDTVSEGTLRYEQEIHLTNLKQLTFEGDNAEAYWSYDNEWLVFQRTTKDERVPCDQIFTGRVPKGDETGFDYKMVSTGKGRTTCSYYLPDGNIVYSSTHEADEDCPPTPDMSLGYVWPIYDSYEVYITDTAGNLVNKLTDNGFYDAEATLSPAGDKIVFTSNRTGDLELFTMNVDGSDVRQVTSGLGYDGGAFFSPDGSKLVFRASRPKTEEEQQRYKDLLAQGLVAPSDMEIYVCNVDGSDLQQVTDLGKANWAPFFHPSGEKILFSSNHHSNSGRQFNIWMINLDGTGLKQVTFDNEFDAFPMFSFDGKYLVFSSNRNNGDTRDTNIFVAEWND